MKQWLILISFSARAITVTKSKTNKNVENFFFDVKKLWRVILDKNCQLTIPNWTAFLATYLKFREPFGNVFLTTAVPKTFLWHFSKAKYPPVVRRPDGSINHHHLWCNIGNVNGNRAFWPALSPPPPYHSWPKKPASMDLILKWWSSYFNAKMEGWGVRHDFQFVWSALMISAATSTRIIFGESGLFLSLFIKCILCYQNLFWQFRIFRWKTF